MGWKQHYSDICNGTGDKFIKCIEKYTYKSTDIFTESNHSFNVNSFYIHKKRGVIQSLEIEVGMITQYYLTTLEISLNTNNNLSYTVAMMDPRTQIFSQSPDTLPRSWFKMAKEQTGKVQFHLRVNNKMFSR